MRIRPALLLILFFGVGFFLIHTQNGEARRVHLSPEQKLQLEKVQTVLVEVLALTEKGTQDATPLAATVSERLKEIGYTVTTDRSQPHDVEVKIKCEERKTVTGTSPAGGDVELPDSPDRLWKGPACLLTYSLAGRDLGWKKEVRTNFPDAREAAKKSKVEDSGKFAMTHLNQRLQEYDFPVLLSAEWGQVDRLLSILDDAQTPKLRKVKILSTLSDLHAEEAFPQLTKLLETTDLKQETINALGGAGVESIPFLIDFFQTSDNPELRAEAAKALGNLAAKTGDPRTIPPLVHYVSSVLPTIKTSADINFPLLTEVVWAIGKLRWDQSLPPMRELQSKVWLIFDNSQRMADLREAVSWTYKQLDLDGHLS